MSSLINVPSIKLDIQITKQQLPTLTINYNKFYTFYSKKKKKSIVIAEYKHNSKSDDPFADARVPTNHKIYFSTNIIIFKQVYLI